MSLNGDLGGRVCGCGCYIGGGGGSISQRTRGRYTLYREADGSGG